MRGRRIIQRGGPAPVMRRNRRRVGSCGNGPHGDRPGGFFCAGGAEPDLALMKWLILEGGS